MGRNGFFGSFQGIDAFGKTMEDVKIRTRTGALLTFLSFSIILTSVMLEFIDYRRIHLEPTIMVDRSRGEKLVVEVDVTFPRVPCYLLSLDITDISGEHQSDITHDITKSRVSKEGRQLETLKSGALKGDVERAMLDKNPDYCGSCYGGSPPESGCCNTCDDVREAYTRKGWSFTNPDGIEQCVEEGWTDKIKIQNTEGCRLTGRVRVNKVIGNLHFSPGRSFTSNRAEVGELVPYLRDNNHHDFGHIIHSFRFGADVSREEQASTLPKEMETRRKLGIRDPLQAVGAHTEESDYMFQYFLKVVSTTFQYLNGNEIQSHQYSVTQYERDLTKGNQPQRDEHGHMTSHSIMGMPGVFFNYEISPMKVVHTETRQSFAHFLTSTCAIIGGVLTIAGLIDSLIFSSKKALAGKGQPVGQEGFGGRAGKMM